MIFVKNCKFPLCFFDSINLEIMSDDHLVKQLWIPCSHDAECFQVVKR